VSQGKWLLAESERLRRPLNLYSLGKYGEGVVEMASKDETRELVVPHLDTGAAATLIGSLAADRDKLGRFGDAVRELARTRFDMGSYVSALDELAGPAC
jgi:hypothetical protein